MPEPAAEVKRVETESPPTVTPPAVGLRERPPTGDEIAESIRQILYLKISRLPVDKFIAVIDGVYAGQTLEQAYREQVGL